MATNQLGALTEGYPGWFVACAVQLTQKPTNEPTIQLTNSPLLLGIRTPAGLPPRHLAPSAVGVAQEEQEAVAAIRPSLKQQLVHAVAGDVSVIDESAELRQRVVGRVDEGGRVAVARAVGQDEHVARTALDSATALHVRCNQGRPRGRARVDREHGQIEPRARVPGDPLALRHAKRDRARRVHGAARDGATHWSRRERITRGDALEHDLTRLRWASLHRGERLERLTSRKLVECSRGVPHPTPDLTVAVGTSIPIERDRTARTEIEVVKVAPPLRVQRHRRDLTLDRRRHREQPWIAAVTEQQEDDVRPVCETGSVHHLGSLGLLVTAGRGR